MSRIRRRSRSDSEKVLPTRAMHVLVVDDDAETREAFRALLTQAGMAVIAAGSVNDALRVVRSLELAVVLSDLVMPEEDGFALVRRLRDLERGTGRHLPAIAVTGLEDPDVRRQALSAGFDACLRKPVAPATIVSTVAQAAHH
jgi:CheY-like chemotaxis protein